MAAYTLEGEELDFVLLLINEAKWQMEKEADRIQKSIDEKINLAPEPNTEWDIKRRESAVKNNKEMAKQAAAIELKIMKEAK
jgi:hypothetical protein